MERLKLILEKYSRWQSYGEYVERILLTKEEDFSVCVENAKSLIEGIAKEICNLKKQPLASNESMGRLLSLSFGCLGFHPSNTIRQIAQSVSNIGQQMGIYRNEIGSISHGRTIKELEDRKLQVDSYTSDFLLSSVENLCSFLIEAFETEYPLPQIEPDINYDDEIDFNNYWDEMFAEYKMNDYSFTPSEVLYSCDPKAYKVELNNFKLIPPDETDN